MASERAVPSLALGSRRGLSLIEVAVSIAAVSVLLVSIGSVVVLSSKAIPERGVFLPTSASAGAVTDQITEELRYAMAVSELAPSAVTFTVPDRDGNGTPDTIRYALSGESLTRTVGGNTPVTVLGGVKTFDLAYTKRKVTQTSNSTTSVSSGELLFSKFTGPGTPLFSSTNIMMVTGTAWIAVGVPIEVSIPAGATSVKLTRVTLRGAKPNSGAGPVTVTVHRPATAGSAVPAPASVGSGGTLPITGVTSSFGWVEVVFPDAVFDGPVSEVVLLLKGTGTTGARFEYLNDTLALLDSRSMRWTGNSGGTWQPSAALLGSYDMFYHLYGTYEISTVVTANVDTYYLTGVNLELKAGSGDSTKLRAGTHVLNEPGVPGP